MQRNPENYCHYLFMQYLQEPNEMLKNKYTTKDIDTKGVLPPGTRRFTVVS